MIVAGRRRPPIGASTPIDHVLPEKLADPARASDSRPVAESVWRSPAKGQNSQLSCPVTFQACDLRIQPLFGTPLSIRVDQFQ